MLCDPCFAPQQELVDRQIMSTQLTDQHRPQRCVCAYSSPRYWRATNSCAARSCMTSLRQSARQATAVQRSNSRLCQPHMQYSSTQLHHSTGETAEGRPLDHACAQVVSGFACACEWDWTQMTRASGACAGMSKRTHACQVESCAFACGADCLQHR